MDPTYSYSYSYDPIGNRVAASEAGVLWTYTTNSLNQYTAATENNVQLDFAYDLDGSMTYRPVDTASGWTQVWNGENRMVETYKGNDRLTFKYDYMGRRVEKCVYSNNTLTSRTLYVYDGFKCVEELDALDNNAATLRHTWQPFDVGLDVILATIDSRESSFYLCDGSKNVMQVTDTDSIINGKLDYQPFGKNVTSIFENFAFSSEQSDIETNMYCYMFRDYHPFINKWMSRDPIEETENEPNLYVFTQNSPIQLYDSLGLDAISFEVNGPQTPSGWSFFGRFFATSKRCPVELEGGLFLAAEWQPPRWRSIKKFFNRFNIYIEFGARGGGTAKFKYSECLGLSETKICMRLEAFGRADYRQSGFHDRHGRFTRLRFGVEADGGCDLCINLCNGEVTADCAFSYYMYLNFGTNKYNRTYNFADTYGRNFKLGILPGVALLRSYCNSSSSPNSCCCRK